jgi:hypothetical protein
MLAFLAVHWVMLRKTQPPVGSNEPSASFVKISSTAAGDVRATVVTQLQGLKRWVFCTARRNLNSRTTKSINLRSKNGRLFTREHELGNPQR